MNDLDLIIEQILTEATLSKGSQRVMNNKAMVADLADTVRDDARADPSNFPAGAARSFQKAPDEEVAQWFLELMDQIEREGYEGTVYSRDGVNNEWIARRYIAGSHNMEDLRGVMNMNLRDFYLLKNRNMLEPTHQDIFKFNSVRDIGRYMVTHYKDRLEAVRDAAKNAARNKGAKSVKLVDNDDYRIYTTLNRAAGCLLGLGTQWCTANSNYAGNFHSYSGRAMLFQMFPYRKVQGSDGKLTHVTNADGKKELDPNEKYQFDAGTPAFMDATDSPANKEYIVSNFPYLYTDLVKGLRDNKEKMEAAFEQLSNDPSLQHEDFKIKKYEIDEEIKKLQKFVAKGYFTDKVRPRPAADHEQITTEEDEMEMDPAAQTGGMIGSMGAGGPSGGQKYPPGTAPTMPESLVNKGNIMENVDKDVADMLASLKKYDTLKESVAPVIGMKTLGEKKDLPPWLKDKKEDGADSEGGDTDAKKDDKKEEKVDEGVDQEVLSWMKRFAKLGNMKGYGR